VHRELWSISGLRREVDENWAVLGHYVASSGHFLPTFRDDLSVPSSGAKNPSPLKIESFAHEDEVFLGGDSWPLRMEPIGFSRNVGLKLPLLVAQ